MYWRTIPTSKTQLIIGALKFAEFPDYISIDYGHTKNCLFSSSYTMSHFLYILYTVLKILLPCQICGEWLVDLGYTVLL